MSTPRIDSMKITYGPHRPKPKSGDEKVVKGVTMIRQIKRVPDGMPYAGAWIYNGSRPCFEWVIKGSDKDQHANSARRLREIAAGRALLAGGSE
jgi:hypothetical protein